MDVAETAVAHDEDVVADSRRCGDGVGKPVDVIEALQLRSQRFQRLVRIPLESSRVAEKGLPP